MIEKRGDTFCSLQRNHFFPFDIHALGKGVLVRGLASAVLARDGSDFSQLIDQQNLFLITAMNIHDSSRT